MEPEFWINKWKAGTGKFHQEDYNEYLTKYFPNFKPQENETVFVPLCGKSKDMLYFLELGLKVVAIELYEQAVIDFFKENQITEYEVVEAPNFKQYKYQSLTLLAGNFFDYNEVQKFDYIYDRAALIALPSEMRKNYVAKIKNMIKQKGQYLLLTLEYDQSQMDGPPFSVTEEELMLHFADQFEMTHLETHIPKIESATKLAELTDLKEKVFQLVM